MTMPTYLELVEKVAKLEAMTDSMPSRAESEQTIHADDTFVSQVQLLIN